MQINRASIFAVALGAALYALSAFSDAAPHAGERQPTPMPAAPVQTSVPAPVHRSPAPADPVQVAAPDDWRAMPLAGGEWVWTARAGGSVARFGLAGAAPVALLLCDRSAGLVRLVLPDDPAHPPAPVPHQATITASTSAGTFAAEHQTIEGRPALTVTLPAGHRLLDAMAFSRGRFRVSETGTAPVVLPSWSEVGRVVEDCRAPPTP